MDVIVKVVIVKNYKNKATNLHHNIVKLDNCYKSKVFDI